MLPDYRKLKSDIFEDGFTFKINKYSYDEYDEIKMHSHDFIEIAFVYIGKGFHVVDGKEYAVMRGDLYIINSDTFHSFYPIDRENSGKLAVYNCMFMPSFIENLGLESGLLKKIIGVFLYKSIFSDEIGYPPDISLKGSAISEAEAVFDKMFYEYTWKSEGYIDLIKLYLCELLVKIFRFHKIQNTQAYAMDYKLQLINNAMTYLKNNLSNKLSLGEISQHVFLSKSYFAFIFKDIIGISVFDYIQKLRIEKACSLLLESRDKITEISKAVGYNDYRFFNKTFKKITGLTAMEYRERNRK